MSHLSILNVLLFLYADVNIAQNGQNQPALSESKVLLISNVKKVHWK